MCSEFLSAVAAKHSEEASQIKFESEKRFASSVMPIYTYLEVTKLTPLNMLALLLDESAQEFFSTLTLQHFWLQSLRPFEVCHAMYLNNYCLYNFKTRFVSHSVPLQEDRMSIYV